MDWVVRYPKVLGHLNLSCEFWSKLPNFLHSGWVGVTKTSFLHAYTLTPSCPCTLMPSSCHAQVELRCDLDILKVAWNECNQGAWQCKGKRGRKGERRKKNIVVKEWNNERWCKKTRVKEGGAAKHCSCMLVVGMKHFAYNFNDGLINFQSDCIAGILSITST